MYATRNEENFSNMCHICILFGKHEKIIIIHGYKFVIVLTYLKSITKNDVNLMF